MCQLLRDKGFDVKVGDPLSFGRVPDVVGLPGIHVECKRHERLELAQWIKQAQEDSVRFSDGVPCVFHRSNRGKWIVSLDLDNFLELYRKTVPPR